MIEGEVWMKADLWKTLTVSDRQQVAPGKVITSLFRRPAASCRGWRRACFNISRCLAVLEAAPLARVRDALVRRHPCRSQSRTLTVASPIPPPSLAAAAVSTAPSPTRDTCLVRRQECCLRDNGVVLSLPHDRCPPKTRP